MFEEKEEEEEEEEAQNNNKKGNINMDPMEFLDLAQCQDSFGSDGTLRNVPVSMAWHQCSFTAIVPRTSPCFRSCGTRSEGQ